MKRFDLINQLRISSGTLAKMGKNEEASLNVITKICEKYNCDYGDLISYKRVNIDDNGIKND